MPAKPLNAVEKGCNPISSNCVIWQGPAIECINLCPGDTVSDVVYKLATELCNIMEVLNISTYQDAMACFGLATGAGAPSNFTQLIELLTKRICNLEQCTGCVPDCNGNSEMVLPDTVSTPCCETLVPIAPCFYYPDPATGDTVTQLPLSTYVHNIGNKICDILTTLASHGITLNNLNVRVTALENAPAPSYTPTPIASCLSGTTVDPFVLLGNLESQFCLLQAATGDPNTIMTNIPAPAGLANSTQLCGTGKVSDLPGWNTPAGNMGSTVGNIWAVIMDMRCAIENALACCPKGCDAVVINMTALISGNYLNITFTGNLPTGTEDCYIPGNNFTVTDSLGNSMIQPIRIVNYINTGVPFSIDLSMTSIDPTLDITITSTACIKNDSEGYTCEKYLSYFIANIASCPAVVLSSSTYDTLSYAFNSAAGSSIYTIQLWSSDGTVMITSHTVSTTSIVPVAGTFTGLSSNTVYRVRVLVTRGVNTTSCPDNLGTTISAPCLPPDTVVPSICITP